MSKCGTQNGPQEHRDRGEPPCDECLKAAREYMAEYRLRRAVQENPQGELRKALLNAKKAQERLRVIREEITRLTGS